MKKQLVVRNLAQKVLFMEELQGQISDGMWENARPFEHWKVWCDSELEVIVNANNVGRNFSAIKSNYNLNSSELLECVGDRMVLNVRAYKMFNMPFEQLSGEDQKKVRDDEKVYTMTNMRYDLQDLRKILGTYRHEEVAEVLPTETKKERKSRTPRTLVAQPEATKYRTETHTSSGEANAVKDTTPKTTVEKVRLTSAGVIKFVGKGWYQFNRSSRIWVKATEINDENEAPMSYFVEADLLS